MKKHGHRKLSSRLPATPKTEDEPQGVVLPRGGFKPLMRTAQPGKLPPNPLRHTPGANVFGMPTPVVPLNRIAPVYNAPRSDTPRRASRAEPGRSHHDDALQLLEDFVGKRKLDPVAMIAILAQLTQAYEARCTASTPVPSLPDAAPVLWAQRDLNLRENAPQFIRRVYGAWLGRGLSRKRVKSLDPDLYRALSVWLTRHPDDEIANLLPRQSDLLDDLIDRLSAEFSLEDLRKLGYAINARLRRDSKPF